MNTLRQRLASGICAAATLVAAGLAPAWGDECRTADAPESARTISLSPQKQADGRKNAIAAAKWLVVKADKDARVVVVETESGSAVHATSGTVSVRNLLDKSVVRVAEGCAYETVVRGESSRRQPEAFIGRAAETIVLFETKSNTSYLYRLDSTAKLRAEILSPPLNQTYLIGDSASARVPMSRLANMHFPPAGVVVWHPPTPALAEQGNRQ